MVVSRILSILTTALSLTLPRTKRYHALTSKWNSIFEPPCYIALRESIQLQVLEITQNEVRKSFARA